MDELLLTAMDKVKNEELAKLLDDNGSPLARHHSKNSYPPMEKLLRDEIAIRIAHSATELGLNTEVVVDKPRLRGQS